MANNNQQVASYVLLGPILTPNPNSTLPYDTQWEQAIAVRGSDIVFIGSEEELNKQGLIGETTSVIKLEGDQVVIPGFQDGHVHPLAAGIRESRCSLEQAQSWRESLGLIQLYMESNPDLEWVTGSGWHWDWFADEAHGKPFAHMLDEVTKNKPAVFRSYDGHNAWCNSEALKRAGLFEDIITVFHCDKHIERHHETKHPTGLLHDEAMPLIYKLLPPLTLTQKLKGLELAMKKLYKNGITTFQDAMVRKSNLSIWLASYGVTPQKEIEEAVKKLGTLPRASLCLLWELDSGFTKESAISQIEHFVKTRDLVNKSGKSDRVRADTVKIMLDGTIESQTAYLHQPYLNSNGNAGSPLYTKEELTFIFTEVDKLNFQIHVHAIGDATVTMALDAFEFCRKNNPQGINNRHHIAHLQLVDPADVPRFQQINVVANFQPYWFLVDHDKHKVKRFIGETRYDYQYPIKTVIETGATIAFGSDFPFGALDPIAGLHTAVNHFHPAASLHAPDSVLSPPSLSSSASIASPSVPSSHNKNVHNDHNFDVRNSKKAVGGPETHSTPESLASHEEESCRGYTVFRPEQKITLREALHYYTMGAAHVNYSEEVSGSLQVGKKADLIVLSNNIVTMKQEYINETVVKLTMANGTVVYNALE